VSTCFERYECSFYSFGSGIWWGKLLVNADLMVCDRFHNLYGCFAYPLSNMDEVCSLDLFFGFNWPSLSLWRPDDIRSPQMDRLWFI